MARRYHRRFIRLTDRLAFESIEEAVALIVAGRVRVNGVIVTNPAARVAADAPVTVLPRRVLRGTVKLRAALRRFAVPVSGRVCLDVGAAAGGFTAALLEAGASTVYAVDVGYGQLAGWLRQDPRVVNLERTNLADLGRQLRQPDQPDQPGQPDQPDQPDQPGQPDQPPDGLEVICLDLSYLALADAIPQLASLPISATAQLIGLVKPTFELRASSLLLDDDAITKAVAAAAAAAETCGWSVDHQTVAVTGGGGAPEVFICATRRQGW